MWEMFTNSMQMFIKGKLFRDNKLVVMQGAIGVVVAIILIVLLGKFVLPKHRLFQEILSVEVMIIFYGIQKSLRK